MGSRNIYRARNLNGVNFLNHKSYDPERHPNSICSWLSCLVRTPRVLERSDPPQNLSILSLALAWARERPKRLKGRPKGAKGSPKGPQRHPKATQGEPKEGQGHPKGSQREPKSHRRKSKTPKGSQKDQIYISNSRSTAPADVILCTSYIVTLEESS